MPGITTHYLFGQQALRNIDDSIDIKPIQRYPNCFNLGLQGPDLFYFSPYAWLMYDENVGNTIHDENVKAFFEALMQERDKFRKVADREICDAYICGFIGHYTLDTACHPYIYYRTKHFNHSKDSDSFDFGLHVFLETDINNAVLKKVKHLSPTEFKVWETVHISPHEEVVLARLLYRAIPKAHPNHKQQYRHLIKAFKTIRLVHILMNDPTGLKKIGVRILEGKFAGHAIVSSMIPSGKVQKYKDPCNTRHLTWKNPWDESITSSDSVYDIMDKASLTFTNRIDLYMNAFHNKPHDRHEDHTAWVNAVLNDLGNCSYCSGLEL